MKCIVHPEVEATVAMKVPCAPGGKLWVCGECSKPENGKRVFEAYRAKHAPRIDAFKSVKGNKNN